VITTQRYPKSGVLLEDQKKKAWSEGRGRGGDTQYLEKERSQKLEWKEIRERECKTGSGWRRRKRGEKKTPKKQEKKVA